MRKYAKGWLSLLVTALVLLIGVLTDNKITVAEALTIGGSFVGTIAVIGFPNLPGNPAVKTVAQALAPALSGLALAVIAPDGVSASVLIGLAVTSLGAVGVYGVSNVGDRYARELAAAGGAPRGPAGGFAGGL